MKQKKQNAVIVSSYVDGRLKKIAKAQRFSDSELWEIGFNTKLGLSPLRPETIQKLILVKEDAILELQREILLLKESLPTIPNRINNPIKEKTVYCIMKDDKCSGKVHIPLSTYKENPSNYELLSPL